MRHALWRGTLAKEGALFLAVSNDLREQAIAAGYPADRTLTHYNGVDLGRFEPGGDDDGKTVLHVGRLVEKKGTAVLLRAFAEVRNRHSGASLVIVGDGPLRGSLERLSGELGLSGAVRFIGFQSPAVVAEWMRRAAVVAVPSLRAEDGDAEGLPNVVVEAAASGRPVVATDHGGIREAVADGVTGFLVPEDSATHLALRLGELLESAELRRPFGLAARALAGDRFDLRRQMARLELLYDDVTSTSAIATR